MQYHNTELSQYLQSYNTITPTQEILQGFINNTQQLLATNPNESEEYQKNKFRDFLRESFHYDCNTKGRIDLAIYNDYKDIEVIIEFKAINNTQEFPKHSDTLHSKALCETILYYLRESKTNNNIKHIIIATIHELFIIDAKEYEIFKHHKALQKAYKNCDDKEGNDTSTNNFYKEAQNIIESMTDTIKYTHIRLDSIISHIHSKSSSNPNTTISLIYQVLSPQALLKQKTYIDANTLNESFYKELLYILGLQEISQNKKSCISPSLINNTLLDSILKAFSLSPQDDFETIFSLLTTWNNRLLFLRLLESMLLSCKHIDKPFLTIDVLQNFTKLNTLFFEVLAIKEDKRQDIPKDLASIPYLNSSLFDKTNLEKEGKEIKLLDSKPLKLYPQSILYKDKNLQKSYNLNKDSSLPLLEYLFGFLHAYDFTTTPQDIQDNIKINHDKLINAAVLGLVFEKLNGYKDGSFYTPSFITSYMCKESLQKAVIQKFNTAKEWDCKDLESLKLRLDKLTDSKGGYKEANEIFDSIKVCDPAVGSGHFLVSMLNAMIELKFHLKILCEIHTDSSGTRQYERLKDINLKLENDEILIKDSTNSLHTYQIPSHENIQSHRIQKALFHNKRTLIESCLFGVDINPNSCEITKLRLWIELLKYSYYIFENDKNTNTLQTLPNIDINIKYGNSLISRFDLKDSLKHIPNINHQIAKYQKLVSSYKNADQSTLNISKQEIEAQIEKIKQTFTLTLKDPKTKQELEKAIETHITNYGISLLDNTSLLDGLSYTLNMFGNPQLSKEQENEAYISYGKIMALRKKLDSFTSGESYKNAFEWRFAFPEVLDNNGDFLGFDLVIGNPPYISAPSQLENTNLALQRQTINNLKKYKSLYQKWDLYIPFIELGISKLCKENAVCAMIIPYPFTNQLYAKVLRDMITTSFNLYELADLQGIKVFDSAVVTNCIIFVSKQKFKNKISISNANENLKIQATLEKTYDDLIQDQKTLVFNTTAQNRKADKHQNLNNLGDFCYISIGMVLNADEKTAKGEFKKDDLISNVKDKIHCKEYIEAKDIEKYAIKRIRYLEYNTPRSPSKLRRPTFPQLYENEKILINKIGNIKAIFDKNNIFCDQTNRICILWKDLKGVENNSISGSIKKFSRFSRKEMEELSLSMNLKYILGILNSKYSNMLLNNIRGLGNIDINPEYLRNIPIPKIDSTNKALSDEIISLVEQILDSKAKDPTTDTKELESHIDSLVYKLYNLDSNEIEIVEGRQCKKRNKIK
ncbi:DUF7149 domain-containing protein [Helicobacter trogontum]|uniref:site-specific DNA-methyltransferase (adenine-specific) n=1 Tax=Helicobacter trogontum TaxID=50960 RepID=A0A4U8SF79_9HELI|nr:Eco57I restriction-modification methylase domain-containing protein [Helicobacter trogontum]TLD84868.1 class I SAM-dependent DNA methyltransferase [Helicobacter trogontum]